MKLGNGWERKLRRGSASLGLCIIVLVAVLLLNVGMTARLSRDQNIAKRMRNVWFDG